jgi:transmembrane sensor
LDQGEAFFEVTPDATRPFVVTVGESRVTAMGTSFAVRYEPDSTAVTLVEGKVSVADDAAKSDFTLLPGQRLTLAKAHVPRMDAPRLEAVTAWRRGEVILNDTPLVEAVAEMNRYNKKSIVLESPEIAMLDVSGLYHTGDSEGFARSIAVMHGLQLTERDRKIYLHR